MHSTATNHVINVTDGTVQAGYDGGIVKLQYALPSSAESLPTEFRIFKLGVNESTHGDFVFDAASAKSVIAAYKDHGAQLSLDYEHQALAIPPAPAPAAGWFGLEMRADGLYAINVKWSDRAAQMLTDKEYRYFSPAFEVDRSGDVARVARLINVALTNLPAMKNLTPLVTAKVVPFGKYQLKAEGSWDGAAAEARVRAWASSGDQINYSDYSKAFTWYDEQNREALSSYKLPHHDVVGGQLVTTRAGVIAAGNAVSGSRGGVAIPESEMGGVRSHLAKHYAEFDMKPPWTTQEAYSVDECDCEDPDDAQDPDCNCDEEMNMNGFVAALGMKEDVKEAEALSEAIKLRDFRGEVLKLTGADSHGKALGLIAAWQKSHADIETLTQQVAEFRATAEAKERAEVMAQIKGRVVADQDEEAIAKLNQLPLESLKVFAAIAKPLAVPPVAVAKQDHSEETTELLSDAGKKLLRQLNVSEDQLRAKRQGK